jgi:organic radical activating enzyme
VRAVVITGGEPLLHYKVKAQLAFLVGWFTRNALSPDMQKTWTQALSELIPKLQAEGYAVEIETNGTLAPKVSFTPHSYPQAPHRCV